MYAYHKCKQPKEINFEDKREQKLLFVKFVSGKRRKRKKNSTTYL